MENTEGKANIKRNIISEAKVCISLVKTIVELWC